MKVKRSERSSQGACYCQQQKREREGEHSQGGTSLLEGTSIHP